MPTPSPADVSRIVSSDLRGAGSGTLAGVGSGVRPVGAVLELVRWPNALIAASGVLLGALRGGQLTARSWLAALAAVCLTAVANSVNDVYDRDIDRVAHPGRPLPRGAVHVATAVTVAAGAAVIALAASFAAAAALGALSIVVLAAMLAYSRSFKRHGLAGNALVAVLASLPFVYGAWSVGRPGEGVALAILAAPLHFAREVAKDVDDLVGDAPIRRTLPLAHGPRAARAVVLAALAIFTLLAVRYFAGSSAPPLALFAATLACLAWAASGAARGRAGVPSVIKGAMLLAIAAAALDIVMKRA